MFTSKVLLLVSTLVTLSLAQMGYEGNENLYIGKCELKRLKIPSNQLLKYSTGNVDNKRVKCLVCRATVDEVRQAQAKVEKHKKAEVRAGRFQPDGSLSGELIEFRKSEQYLTELFEGEEGICKVMDDYAKAKFKTTGKLTILKMFTDGNFN